MVGLQFDESLSADALQRSLTTGQPAGFPFGDFAVEDVMIEGDMGIPSEDEEEEIDEPT